METALRNAYRYWRQRPDFDPAGFHAPGFHAAGYGLPYVARKALAKARIDVGNGTARYHGTDFGPGTWQTDRKSLALHDDTGQGAFRNEGAGRTVIQPKGGAV